MKKKEVTKDERLKAEIAAMFRRAGSKHVSRNHRGVPSGQRPDGRTFR